MCRDCGCEIATEYAKDLMSQKLFQPQGIAPQKVDRRINEKIEGKAENTAENKAERKIEIGKSIVQKNIDQAQLNREWFKKHNISVVNIMSAPGSGKTYLLEKTVLALQGRLELAILTGDQEMSYDADRLSRAGGKVKQINTMSSCHLNSSHIQKELESFVTQDTQLLIIENVGNLVCPAAFDLGEGYKVALLSTTEGEDKPSKYPLLFHEADLIVVTKMDLVPHLDWQQDLCEKHIRKVNARAPILYVSAKTAQGMDAWVEYLSGLSARAVLAEA